MISEELQLLCFTHFSWKKNALSESIEANGQRPLETWRSSTLSTQSATKRNTENFLRQFDCQHKKTVLSVASVKRMKDPIPHSQAVYKLQPNHSSFDFAEGFFFSTSYSLKELRALLSVPLSVTFRSTCRSVTSVIDDSFVRHRVSVWTTSILEISIIHNDGLKKRVNHLQLVQRTFSIFTLLSLKTCNLIWLAIMASFFFLPFPAVVVLHHLTASIRGSKWIKRKTFSIHCWQGYKKKLYKKENTKGQTKGQTREQHQRKLNS